MNNIIHIYTDGSSRGNPGPGGWGVIVKFQEHCFELSGGEIDSTNNRMELLAVIKGLEFIKTEKYPVKIFSDSKYVVDSVEKGWLFNWVKKPNFDKKKNKDLWLRFLKVYQKFEVSFVWMKGHNGHPENERCDYLATQQSLFYEEKHKT